MGKRMPREKVEFDHDACSYVIRMWRESAASDLEQGEWRGWIEHVQSRKRIFFRDTEEITSFIDKYLHSTSQ
jgi:hypothetical protein